MKAGFEGSIGKLAKASSTPVETIRFYQKQRILPIPPSNGSLRRYCQEDLERLEFVKRAKALGFTLREVRSLLDLAQLPAPPCGKVRQKLESRKKDIQEQLAALASMQETLESLLSQCKSLHSPLTKCPILDSLNPPSSEACSKCR